MTTEAVKTTLDELLEAVRKEAPGFKSQEKNEDEQTFLKRLLEGVSGLSEVTWKTISETSQAWFNGAVSAVNNLKPIPPCPNGIGVTSEKATGAVEKPSSSAKAAETPAQSTSAKKPGVMHRAREIAIQNPGWDVNKVATQLTTEGWGTPSADTVWICVQEVKNVTKAVETAGLRIVKFGGA